MEEVRHHQLIGNDYVDAVIRPTAEFVEQRISKRNVFYAAAAVVVANTVGLVWTNMPESRATEPCVGQDCAAAAMADTTPVTGDVTLAPAVTQGTTETKASPRISREIPPVDGIDPVVNERMRAMEISPAGLMHFMDSLDYSQRAVAGSYAEFNPALNKKQRMPMDQITLHVTGEYYNDDGKAQTSIGNYNPVVFIRGIANRYGSVLTRGGSPCCAVQSTIARDAHPFLLTGWNDPVQHNPPTDSREFGIEIEAVNDMGVTTDQWNATAYMSIIDRRQAGETDPVRLVNSIEGHFKRRQDLWQEYLNTNHYHDQYPTFAKFKDAYAFKPDIKTATAELFRRTLLRALTEYPELMTMPLHNVK